MKTRLRVWFVIWEFFGVLRLGPTRGGIRAPTRLLTLTPPPGNRTSDFSHLQQHSLASDHAHPPIHSATSGTQVQQSQLSAQDSAPGRRLARPLAKHIHVDLVRISASLRRARRRRTTAHWRQRSGPQGSRQARPGALALQLDRSPLSSGIDWSEMFVARGRGADSLAHTLLVFPPSQACLECRKKKVKVRRALLSL